jgi:glucokinase-like ROK family protein
MRERNLAVILDALRKLAPISRSGLAKTTGLNKATVTSLTRELFDAGFIRELETIPSESVGRPARGIGLDPSAGTILSVEIAVDYISAIVTDFGAEILWRHNEPITAPPDQRQTLGRTLEILDEAHSTALQYPGRVFGIACSVPGLVEQDTGTLLYAPNMKWVDVPLRETIGRHFGYPVFVTNEAQMAALGETYFGAAQNVDHVLYVSSGVGLGGGIVVNGEIHLGATGFAGEIGHMTMVPDGYPCNCGNRGCWETLVSQWAVYRTIRAKANSGQPTLLVDATEGDLDRLTIALVVEALEAGDEVARSALADAGRWLGIGIANLVNVLNPQRVVFGGVLSQGHQLLIPIIQDVVAERAWRWSREGAEIVVAEYGVDASVMGGVAAVYRNVINHQSRWTPDEM